MGRFIGSETIRPSPQPFPPERFPPYNILTGLYMVFDKTFVKGNGSDKCIQYNTCRSVV